MNCQMYLYIIVIIKSLDCESVLNAWHWEVREVLREWALGIIQSIDVNYIPGCALSPFVRCSRET